MTDDSDDLDGPILDPADDAAITSLLADLPQIDMPDDVAERIATVLAGEVPLSGPAPAWAVGGATNVSVLPSQRERDQRKAARRGRVLSAAAAVVLVLGAVALGTQFFQGNDNGTAGTAGGADSALGGQAPVEATLLSSSGTDYTQADLAPKVTGLVTAASAKNAPVTTWAEVATPSTPSTPPSSSSSPTPGPATLTDVHALARTPLSALAVCIAKLGAVAGQHPVAVDTGTWTGSTGAAKPAAVIVLPGEDPSRVDVFVVTASCGDPAVVDDSYLLYYASVPRR